MKKTAIAMSLLGLLTVFTGLASAEFPENWQDENAKVNYIFQRDYEKTVKRLVHGAKKSIVVAMYFMDYTRRGDDPIVVKLVDDLVNARKRGVTVRVILENTILLNNRAYKKLKENDVEVLWDHNSQITHAKAVVVDDRYVLIGSHNWTERAFRMNNETSVLIESPKVAKMVLSELTKLKLLDLSQLAKAPKEAVFVPESFVLDPKLGPKMVTTSAERAFDLYLILLKMSQDEPEKPAKSTITVNYEKLSKYFGDLEKKGLNNYKRGVQKELTKLEKKYKLIKWDRKHGEDPEITLLDYDDPNSPLKVKKKECLAVPKVFWDYGYSKSLSQTAKFMYLVSLHQTSISPISPWWSLAQDELTNIYHVKRWTISKGLMELQLANIEEVENSRTDEEAEDYGARPPNRYKLNNLISEAEEKAIYDKLIVKHGQANFDEAKKMAKDLDEPNDPLIIDALLELIQIHALEAVKKAVAIPAKFKPDNSQKHIRYVIGILQRQEDGGTE